MRLPSFNNRGFTLLELIVVMVLIALTISLAVPKFSNFLYTDQLKVAARRLAGFPWAKARTQRAGPCGPA